MDADLWGTESDEEKQERLRLEHDEVSEMDTVLKKAFSTPNGRRAFAYLRTVAMQPGFDPAMGYEQAVANGFAREGQKAMVEHVEMRMNRATS